GAGYPKEKLATEFGLTPDTVDQIIARLKVRGLVAEVHGDINGYIPGRAARTIKLEDVLAAFRATDVEIAHILPARAMSEEPPAPEPERKRTSGTVKTERTSGTIKTE